MSLFKNVLLFDSHNAINFASLISNGMLDNIKFLEELNDINTFLLTYLS